MGDDVLVLGMGNPVLRDDAVGIRLAAEVRRRLGGVAGVTVLDDCPVHGLDLIDVLAGHRRAVVIDSLRTERGRPGAWHHFTAASLRPTRHLRNVHDVNFATALTLGRCLGTSLPDDEQIHVLAVEVTDPASFDERMTPELERRFPELAREIVEEVRRILADGPNGEVPHLRPPLAPPVRSP